MASIVQPKEVPNLNLHPMFPVLLALAIPFLFCWGMVLIEGYNEIVTAGKAASTTEIILLESD